MKKDFLYIGIVRIFGFDIIRQACYQNNLGGNFNCSSRRIGAEKSKRNLT